MADGIVAVAFAAPSPPPASPPAGLCRTALRGRPATTERRLKADATERRLEAGFALDDLLAPSSGFKAGLFEAADVGAADEFAAAAATDDDDDADGDSFHLSTNSDTLRFSSAVPVSCSWFSRSSKPAQPQTSYVGR